MWFQVHQMCKEYPYAMLNIHFRMFVFCFLQIHNSGIYNFSSLVSGKKPQKFFENIEV